MLSVFCDIVIFLSGKDKGKYIKSLHLREITLIEFLKRKVMTIPELYELFLHNPKVTTDSRNCPFGSLFFALRGEKFDGNQYAEKH